VTVAKLFPLLLRLKSLVPSAQHSRLHGSLLFKVLLGLVDSAFEQFSHIGGSVVALLLSNKAIAPAPKTTASIIESAL
jgi:hypothetical protein